MNRPFNPASGSKIGSVSLDRSKAQAAAPAATTGSSQTTIRVTTFFTKVGEQQEPLYNGDQIWAKVTLTLETAGPVAVGDAANIFPVLSGKGELLQTGVPMTFDVAKGNRLYIGSTSINRVKMVVSPYPWLETITGLVGALAGRVGGGVAAAVAAFGSKL